MQLKENQNSDLIKLLRNLKFFQMWAQKLNLNNFSFLRQSRSRLLSIDIALIVCLRKLLP